MNAFRIRFSETHTSEGKNCNERGKKGNNEYQD